MSKQIDYELNYHYDLNEVCSEIYQHGWTVRFNTDSVIESVKNRFGIIAQKHTLYRFENPELYKDMYSWLNLENNRFIGLLGDDSWVLYQIKFDKVEYWNRIYGDDYIENIFPVYGKTLWNICKDLVII